MQIQETIQTETLPLEFLNYLHEKTNGKVEGGRPHFLSVLAKKGKDPQEELLKICEQAWIKNRSIRLIAKDYHVQYLQIYRVLRDLESLSRDMKEKIANFLRVVPSRKCFYNPELNSSDYETVQNYIHRAKRDELKRYKEQVNNARKCWVFLKSRDPAYWTADEVCQYLATLRPGSQSRALDGIRQVAPQIAIKGSKEHVQTGRFREKLLRHKKDIFGNEINQVHKALDSEKEFQFEKTIFDLQITLGAREGSTEPRSGLVGLTWDRFKSNFSKVDLYESKVRGGIWWRDCPLDLFFPDLPGRLRALWNQRGKPTNEKILKDGYKELLAIYGRIRNALAIYFRDEDPGLLKEFSTLRPHDADKIHVNLLWEAEIPLEVVGGQYIGKGEGIGLMGRGWLDINVIKKYYLSLTGRSERFRKLEKQVHTYSTRFCSGVQK